MPSPSGVVIGLVALGFAAAAAGAADRATAPAGGMFFDLGGAGRSKEPITITADRLEYDYKANVIVYRGAVEATQGEASLKAATLTITLDRTAPAGEPAGAKDGTARSAGKVREVVAIGNVRIDQGTRWASGGRAVLDQGKRTFVLSEKPVLHDGQNEVAGDTVVVYLDENRSVVEGGRQRVKAVLHPGREGDTAPASDAPRRAAGEPSPAGADPP